MTSKVVIVAAFLVFAAIVVLFVVRNLPEKGTPVGQVTDAPITGDEIVLLASGWSDSELQAILSDFCRMYELQGDSFRVLLRDGATQIRISQPIGADMLVFLVNYLHYPKDLSLEDRQIAAIAEVRRSEALGGPSELAGRRATIYVPAHDTEFDEVFVRVDPAKHFRISFTRMQWRPVEEGREREDVKDLMARVRQMAR